MEEIQNPQMSNVFCLQAHRDKMKREKLLRQLENGDQKISRKAFQLKMIAQKKGEDSGKLLNFPLSSHLH